MDMLYQAGANGQVSIPPGKRLLISKKYPDKFHLNDVLALIMMVLLVAPCHSVWATNTADNIRKQSPMSITLTRVPDSEFLKKMDDDPQALATAVPESITRLERVPVAIMPGGFRLAADVYYREKCPAKARPALIFMHDWASGKQPELAGNRQCA